MTRIFLFPGQGSQAKGMGEALFDRYAHLIEQADALLGYSIRELCLDDPEGRLRQTQYTQPALYVVSALAYLHKIESGPKPDAVAGHSLGELCALFAAGAYDFLTGLKIVQKRGELMAEVRGGMAAVVGIRSKEVAELLARAGLPSLDVANFNTATQTVIAGSDEDLRLARQLFEQAGASFMPLNVSAPFHSRLMQNVQQRFAEFVTALPLKPPEIPVIANYSASPYQRIAGWSNLIEQITHPVRWYECVCYLLGLPEPQFEEIGPGSVLTRMLGSIGREYKKESERALAGRSGAESLGCPSFRKEHGVRLAYAAGSMMGGISSEQLVIRMARAGLLSYFGTDRLPLQRIEQAIICIQRSIAREDPYGVSLACTLESPQREDAIVDMFLRYGVPRIEAADFLHMTPALVRYRLKGVRKEPEGALHIPHKVMAKVLNLESALQFLSPPPPRTVEQLLAAGSITKQEAELAERIPMADDLCLSADAAGSTTRLTAATAIPAAARLRDEAVARYRYATRIRVGAAGGLGTPHAVAAAFVLGADFVLTGSINQCTVEAGTSNAVKELLAQADVLDTEFVPSDRLFEQGAKVQVLRRGLFFPARANRLYELYRQYGSLSALDEKTRAQLERRYFKRSLPDVLQAAGASYQESGATDLQAALQDPSRQMALLFRWYLLHALEQAIEGGPDKSDYQIYCGPAMGAFNSWARGTRLEDWKNRHADDIAQALMAEAAQLLKSRLSSMQKE